MKMALAVLGEENWNHLRESVRKPIPRRAMPQLDMKYGNVVGKTLLIVYK